MLLITFMQDEYIDSTVLPDVKKGRYLINHSIKNLTEEIYIDGIENQWIIHSGEEYEILDENSKRIELIALEDNDFVLLRVHDKECTMVVETISDEKNSFSKFCVVSPEIKEYQIRIGKDPQKNDIVLEHPYISGEHAVIFKKGIGDAAKWYVLDEKSTNGTYVNHKKIEKGIEHELFVGDVIFIVGYQFIICAEFIAANIDLAKSLRNENFMEVSFHKFERGKKKHQETEYFYRTIDLGAKKLEFEEVVLLPPERTSVQEEQSMLLSMGSAFTMSTATLLVAAYSGVAAYYRGTNISYVVPSFIMAGSMILSSLIWPTVIRKHKAKTSQQKEELRRQNYQEYIMQLRDAVNVQKDEEKAWLYSQCHTIRECMERVIERNRYLWSKSIHDDDFMQITLGVGKRSSSVKIKYREDSDTFFKDNLRYDMLQFAKEEQILENAPITLSLNNGCICGISGDPDYAFDLIKEMLVQLTALYSYDELKMVFIIKEDEREKWEYVKWFPHVWNEDGSFRYVAVTSDDVKELVNELEKEIEARSSRQGEDFPKLLIVALDKKRVDSIDIMPLMIKNRKQLNISFLTSFGMYNYNNSELIIELPSEQNSAQNHSNSPENVGKHKGFLYDRRENTVTEFNPYYVADFADMTFESYLDRIANIKLDISTEKYQLPKMLTFLDMFRISKVEHLNSLMRWRENNPIKSLKTEIGVAPSGDIFFIDMHEKFHGPHGLIAGTTGSGKSESIITLILSLAVNYSPEEVAFVIVDYKGGGLADAFNDVKEEIIDGKTVEIQYKLPHVVGTVTNLDGATIERACISIDTELKRRQMLFKKARKLSNEGTMDIYKYQQLRREGADLEMLPHLFIVCDEFAELKADRSDFMDLLVSAARIGRSLGIHLVLATQKPDSVVSPQIWSNSRFKICLKVQGKEDSKAVIHCPDAAEISTTGRFFFQVGYNEVFSMGQSAWCGADYLETEEFVKNDTESVEILNNTGTVLYEKSRKPEVVAKKDKHIVSQLIAVRNYLIEIAKDIVIPPLWLTPLPAKISIRQLYEEFEKYPSGNYVPLNPIIGKKDDLYNRVQEIMPVSFSEKGNLMIYGAAGSGMDMFFTSMIYSLLYGYSPEEVILYVLDFDSGFLKTFEQAPHVGDVMTSDESMDVRKLLSGLHEEIIHRSKLFAAYQGKYKDYCKYSDGEKLPNIVLILNNYTEFLEKFDGDDMAELIYIIREGTARGVFVIVGTSTVNVNSRLKQYIQQTFMLKMNDPTDYLGVLGRTGGITPSECEGSGIVKEEGITYKFQIADIFDTFPKEDEEDAVINDVSKEVREFVTQLQEKYEDFSVPSYKFHEVSAENLLEGELSWNHLPVGADGEEIVYYDFSDKYITFVSSISEEKLTDFAGYLCKALSRDKNIDVICLDPTGTLQPQDDAYQYYATLPELEKWNQYYKTLAETRCEKLVRDENGNIVMSEDARHIYIIINSFEALSVMDTLNVTLANFKLIINELPEIHCHYIILDTPEKMNAERGAYFHIVKNIDPTNIADINNLNVEKNRAWFDASGIWLGEGISRTGFFDIGGKSLPLSGNDGVFVQNRKAGKKFTCFS